MPWQSKIPASERNAGVAIHKKGKLVHAAAPVHGHYKPREAILRGHAVRLPSGKTRSDFKKKPWGTYVDKERSKRAKALWNSAKMEHVREKFEETRKAQAAGKLPTFGCVKHTTPKYLKRREPPYEAKDCAKGVKKYGNVLKKGEPLRLYESTGTNWMLHR